MRGILRGPLSPKNFPWIIKVHKTQLRDLIAQALYPTKAYRLPAACERYGLSPGTNEEAFSSKTQYVMKRLDEISDERVIDIARQVVLDTSDEPLQAALEKLQQGGLISDITRQHLGEALNDFPLEGKGDLLDLLRKHWPEIDKAPSKFHFDGTRADDLQRHAVLNPDWSSAEILQFVGFGTCSQAKLLRFVEDVVHPIRRTALDQTKLVNTLNAVLMRDGFQLAESGKISGYPEYSVEEVSRQRQPADALIASSLASFDELSVHKAWEKALSRRASDPEGAITAARTLLETVCKHIIEAAKGQYGDHDDLPKLYSSAAECLNLAPSQHSETVFKTILGNCQSVVGNLAALRNKLGDSHGQGKRYVRPQPRHAELAVNLAGSMAMFMVATWAARLGKSSTDTT